jgi:hypothetical protein
VTAAPSAGEHARSQPLPEAVAVVTALILDRPMCLDCIATKSGVSLTHAEAIVQRIATALKLYREVARCRMCSTVARVVSVERPTDGPPRP